MTGRSMLMAGYFSREVVVYPISKPYEDRGRALINWVGLYRTADGRPMPEQDWVHTASHEAIAPFASFTFDVLNVPALIRAAAVVYQYPMVDRDPLPTWDFGHVTLLGDAAHPMYPVGANGASQAILDARHLARELALQPSVEAAVTTYDAERRPATASVVLANRQAGPERPLDLVDERAPDGFTNLDEVISWAELEEISRNYRRTAGFDPEILNTQPSLSVR